ncbi:MAG: endolytic transglycosylase MltG [Betaproteobacteria bacterium]
MTLRSALRRAAVPLALLALLALAAVWRYQRELPLAGDRVEVRIERGASARAVAARLREAGVGVGEAEFVLAASLSGATQSLRAGRYEVRRGASLRTVLVQLRSGDTIPEKLTIVEGTTFRELRGLLAAQGELKPVTATMSDGEVLAAIGAAEPHPEGLFAPDTYFYDPGTSDLDILRNAYRAQAARLAEAWQARAPGLPLRTPYEALILASIVEKETGRPAERATIAGVFANRLRRGMPLQTDPTVIYGLGASFDGNLRRDHLRADGPYNTYTRAGLPPTPIALPGVDALRAAVQPEPTRALYFVARGDGTSEFSQTLAEHNRAVNKYQRKGRP